MMNSTPNQDKYIFSLLYKQLGSCLNLKLPIELEGEYVCKMNSHNYEAIQYKILDFLVLHENET